jgi:thiol-disulfide isomerase/thioredoxin
MAFAVVALLLLALIAAFVVRLSSGPQEMASAATIAPAERVQAPSLPDGPLPGWDGPGPRTAGGIDAGIVVVNVWASWCGPCREETPALVAIADEYADRGVVVLGADANDKAADAVAFANEFGVTYPLAVADDADLRAWGVRGQPETFVVDAQGRIAAHVPGPVDEITMRALLESALA